MRRALRQAEVAFRVGEVPVGAIVVGPGNEVIARAHNRREASGDPTAHAELIALRRAAKRLGRWRLNDCTLYVTLEPCAMCAGALVNARVGRLVFGAPDPKAGGVISCFCIADDARLNHRVTISHNVLGEECAALLARFFEERRRARAELKRGKQRS